MPTRQANLFVTTHGKLRTPSDVRLQYQGCWKLGNKARFNSQGHRLSHLVGFFLQLPGHPTQRPASSLKSRAQDDVDSAVVDISARICGLVFGDLFMLDSHTLSLSLKAEVLNLETMMPLHIAHAGEDISLLTSATQIMTRSSWCF